VPDVEAMASQNTPDDDQDIHCYDYNTCLYPIGEASVQANTALDDKGDTLTQSQMFNI